MVKGLLAAGLTIALGACATTAGPGAAPAASGALIDRYDEAALKKVAEGLGYKVVETSVSASGKPFMSVEAGGDAAFRIMGESCEGEGKAQVCQGVQFSAQFASDSAEFANLIEQGNRTLRPAKLFPVDVGMAYERYLIMDGGISEKNLATNMSVFVEVLQIVLERL